MSVAADFTVTQVVDQRQGVHGRIDKRCFPHHPESGRTR
jgi:acetamidase/formamidase